MAAGRRITRKQKAQFVENLRRCGIVNRAAAAAGIGQTAVYDLRKRDEEFAAAWEDALGEAIGEVEESVREMATGYVEREFFDEHGNVRQRVFKRDVRAAQLYLAARVPEYRSAHKVEVDATTKNETRVTQRREVDLKGELKKLDKKGRAALREVLKQLHGADEQPS